MEHNAEIGLSVVLFAMRIIVLEKPNDVDVRFSGFAMYRKRLRGNVCEESLSGKCCLALRTQKDARS